MTLDLQTALRRLYDAEIDHGLSAQWDAGWRVWLRAPDGRDCFQIVRDEELDLIGPWLLMRAAEFYPERFWS